MQRTRQPNPTIVLVIVCVGVVLVTLDLFIVNLAFPAIERSFGGTSLSTLSWVLNAYAIVFAALLVPAGRLGDRYGNKRVFLAGLATFTLGSLGCALSDNLWVIVGLRCVQAVGAAALIPTSLGLVLTVLPQPRRAAGVRIWAVTGSLGAAAGPAIGGLLVQLSWRWIFLLNVPIGVAALVAAAVLVPHVRHGSDTAVPDLLGGFLLMLAVGALALGLVQGPAWGWSSARAVAAFAVALVAALAFVWRSKRARSPVIDLRLFRDPVFTWANVGMVVISVAFAIELLGLVFWLQEGWGWSAVQTGLAIAPGPVIVSVTALGLRRWIARLAPNSTAALGALLIGGGGLYIGASLTARGSYVSEVLPGWLVVGMGVGLSTPTIIGAATSGLPAHQTSTGSAVVQMARQLGSVLGVALLVVIVGSSTVSADRLSEFVDAWRWAGLFALAGLIAVLRMRPREAHAVRTGPGPLGSVLKSP
jgi:EmrB/QacA subfamily drug resistance transporter